MRTNKVQLLGIEWVQHGALAEQTAEKNKPRIISAREATRSEREQYENGQHG